MTELEIRYIAAKRAVMRREFSRMNDEQMDAVFTTEGPLLILAGAGSGKTTVLINRAANLLKYGKAYYSETTPYGLTADDVEFLENYSSGNNTDSEADDRAVSLIADHAPHAWQLMAITFTNKAAGELKERLTAMLGEEGNDVWAMTFHATCARMLRRDADRLGYESSFTIYDTDDQKRLIKAVMSELNINEKNLPVKSVIGEISHAKDSMIDPSVYETKAGSDIRLRQIAKIYSLYQKKLLDANAMDFDDLLVNTVHLLERNSDVLEYYQRRFRYIMVDEYQDTNHAQYRMVRLLADGSRNLCVVGDDDQSIYKFRGATIENILGFEKNYPDAKVIRLEQNYRSTQTILDAANSVIAHNKGRHSKRLWTSNDKGTPVVVYSASDERSEAAFISTTITEHVAGGGKYSDCAVLYRANQLSSPIENHMMRAGIPYRVVAGRKFYDRKEIRDAIAYLSVINNPSDEVRLSRIVNEPKRGIGDRSIELASEIAAALGISMFEVFGTADQYANLSRAAGKLMSFYNMICELIEAANDPDVGLADLLDMTLDKSGYITALLASDEKAQDRIENLQELSSTMLRYEEENGEDTTLGGYLEDVALVTDIDAYDDDADCVSLMTLHAAKGLEFPVVFIPGVEEGIFPNMTSMLDVAEIEEDRRLAYVGITRAKKQLYITHAESRILYGQTQRNKLSRYAGEIDGSLIEHRGLTHRSSANASDIISRHENARAAARSSTRITTAPSAASASFAPGDSVKHRVFGEGTIISASPMGNDTLLEINFTKVGTKKLMANFAGLKKL